MRAWALALLVLGPTSAWAQPLPDFDTCTLAFELASYTVYQQTTPTGPVIKMGVIPIVPPVSGSWPCPTAQGTYYYSLASVNSVGEEGIHGMLRAFTIQGGAPPLVLAVGGKAQINALNLLNVRVSAGGAVLGTQRTGTAATIIGGPVTVPFGTPPVSTTFWQLDFPSGVDGWCSAVFLVAIP